MMLKTRLKLPDCFFGLECFIIADQALVEDNAIDLIAFVLAMVVVVVKL